MGRPKELTEAQRSELVASGYTPVEIWVPGLAADAFWAEVEAECRAIVRAGDKTDVDLFITAAAQDMFRSIDGEEAALEREP